jgi:hypothetical protein
MAARTPRATVIETLPLDLPGEVERAVRAAGSLPLARLTRVKLGPAPRGQLEQRLVAAGLERTRSAVRVPLAEQLLALVQGGRRVPVKEAMRRVKGGTKKQVDAALAALIDGGRARVVVRTEVEVLVGEAERALGPHEVAALVAAHGALGKLLKRVKAKGLARSILRDDLGVLLDPILRSTRDPLPDRPVTQIVADALRRLAVLDLVKVPELVRALEGEVSLADVHRALLEAHQAGTIELRPEAPSELLREGDARLCPPGPRGTVLWCAALVKP